jgi:hypothetical protein
MLEIDSMVQVYKGCHAVSVATAQARRTNMSARSLIGILTPIAAIVVLSSAAIAYASALRIRFRIASTRTPARPATRHDQCSIGTVTASSIGLESLNGANGLMSGCMMLSKNMCESVPAVAPIATGTIPGSCHRNGWGRDQTRVNRRANVKSTTSFWRVDRYRKIPDPPLRTSTWRELCGTLP